MSDLISRSGLIEAIKRQYCTGCDNYNGSRCRACHADDMLALVDDAVDAMPRWISVEERLPEGEVLAANFAPGTYGYQEYIMGCVEVVKCTEPDWERGKCYATNDFEILNNVTHWMPLPTLPKEDA